METLARRALKKGSAYKLGSGVGDYKLFTLAEWESIKKCHQNVAEWRQLVAPIPMAIVWIYILVGGGWW